jgi:transcriptional regulator with XRE-family HTH domain
MKPIERLAVYCKLNKIHYSTIEEKVNIAKGYLSRQIKNQASIGSDILERIFTAYPQLNPTWFFTGKGEPQLSGYETGFNDAAGSIVPVSNEHNEIYREQIESLSGHIELLKKEIALLNNTISLLRNKAVD